MEMALDDPSDRPEGTRSFNEALSRITFARCPPFPADVFHMVLADYKATMLMLSAQLDRCELRASRAEERETSLAKRLHVRAGARAGGATGRRRYDVTAVSCSRRRVTKRWDWRPRSSQRRRTLLIWRFCTRGRRTPDGTLG